jgi:hypothetical protein
MLAVNKDMENRENIMTELKTSQFICTSTFDPCYGLPILRPDDKVTIKFWPASENRNSENRVTVDRKGQTNNFGWTISDSDLRNHFNQVK